MQKFSAAKTTRAMLFYLVANPGCPVGPAIWVQKTKSASLHRRLVIEAWPTRPRYQWFCLFLFSLVAWYLFFFWLQLLRCLTSAAFRSLHSKGIGRWRQWSDLLRLGLWYGVRPSDYYVFSLYNRPRSAWLDYVFSQEQLTWHRVFSCPPESVSAELINDKQALEKKLRASGIQTATTIGVLGRSAPVDKSVLFQEKNLFIKPNRANNMRGCLKLLFDARDQVYRLQGLDMAKNRVDLLGEDRICECLAGLSKNADLLVQTMLENSDQLSLFAKREELVTLKVISGLGPGINLAYLLLEIPEQQEYDWSLCPVDRQTGRVQFENASCRGQGSENSQKDVFIPEFERIKPIIHKAHQLVPDIKTLCWDICITRKGVCIIEANTAWGLVNPQQISGTPLLSSGLSACYCKV